MATSPSTPAATPTTPPTWCRPGDDRRLQQHRDPHRYQNPASPTSARRPASGWWPGVECQAGRNVFAHLPGRPDHPGRRRRAQPYLDLFSTSTSDSRRSASFTGTLRRAVTWWPLLPAARLGIDGAGTPEPGDRQPRAAAARQTFSMDASGNCFCQGQQVSANGCCAPRTSLPDHRLQPQLLLHRRDQAGSLASCHPDLQRLLLPGLVAAGGSIRGGRQLGHQGRQPDGARLTR